MKQSVVLLCLAALIGFTGGCKKHKAGIPGDSIVGSWELRTNTSSMTPIQIYPPGNGNILDFTNNTYNRYANGMLVKSGSYILVPDTTAQASTCLLITPGEFTNRIVYDNDFSGRKGFIQVSGTTKLIIISGCFAIDAGQKLEYERQ